jgi:hypothetical protein
LLVVARRPYRCKGCASMSGSGREAHWCASPSEVTSG